MRFWLHFGLHALTLRPVNHVYYIDSVYNYFTVSCQYLPPANVVCEGYVFTPVCDFVNRGGVRGCSWGGHAWLLLGGVCGCSGHAWLLRGGGGMHGIRRDTEIRSLSGWYASYWNAFLFDNKITVLVLYIISIKYFIYHFLNIAKELFLTWFCLAFEQHEK